MSTLNLIVIRSSDVVRAVEFYTALGLQFEKQRHGSGPEHYAAQAGTCVFEIYPLTERDTPTTSVRLGFKVRSLSAALQAVGAGSASSTRAVVSDPDGHRVELTEE